MDDQPREIVLLSRAERALVEANTVDEAKDVRNTAAAVVLYAKKAKLGQSMAAEASAVRLRAERRMGELLQATRLAKAAPGNQYTGPIELPGGNEAQLTLRQLGITKSDSSRSQRIASVPLQTFEEYVAGNLASSLEPTAAGLFRHNRTEQPPRPTANRSRKTRKPAGQPAASVEGERRFATGYLDLPLSRLDSHDADDLWVDDACMLPIGRLFFEEAHLHLWCAPATLLAGLDILEHWDFQYQDALVAAFPTEDHGTYWRTTHGLLLLGVRGQLPLAATGSDVPEHLGGLDGQDRPARLMQIIEQASPGPYAQIFGPKTPPREGWESSWPNDQS